MKKRILFYIGVIFGKIAVSLLFKLNRKKLINEHYLIDAIRSGKSVIMCSWHERLMFPFYYFRDREFYGLASLHGDAEIISRVGKKFGWRFIRGSSTRGGKEAYSEIIKLLKNDCIVVAMTPDGPKGPKHKVKAGAIKAGMRTEAVIIPVSGQATRRWEIKNWDTFVLPKPFGRTNCVIGEPIIINESDDFEISRKKVEEKLNMVMEESNALAGK